MLVLVFIYKMSIKKCEYRMCLNTNKQISVFHFPTHDPERLRLWILNSGNAFLKSLSMDSLKCRYVCAVHFPPTDINKGDVRSRLIKVAVPKPWWLESDSDDLTLIDNLGSGKEEIEEMKDTNEKTSQPENESQEGNTSSRDKSQRLRNKKAFLKKRSKCTVPQCNEVVSDEVSLHICPNNPAVRNEWAEAFKVSYSDVKTLIACSKHFTKLDFTPSRSDGRVLKHNAVPTRNLPCKGPNIECTKKCGLAKKMPFQKQIMNNNVKEEEPHEEKEEKVFQECRACLKILNDKQSFCNIFQSWALPWKGMEPSIAEDLAKLANVEITQTDRHSKVVCEPCYQKLRDAATFASTVRNTDLILRMRFTAEIDMSKVWPKPIQVDKNINGSVYTNPMEVEIKQEVVTDEEYPVNGPENPYVETELANLDIKIEPEEFVEPPPLNITINGTISLDPLNSENRELMNGPQSTQDTTEFIEMAVKQEPASEGEQEVEPAPDLSLECMLCAKPFNSVTGLKAHVIAHHSYKSVKRKSDGSVSPQKKRTDRHICGICHKSFTTSTDLMVHETCHNKYACYACSQKFDSFPLLTRHRKRCKASDSRSVQKLKTLEDVKRPAVEDVLKEFDGGDTIDQLKTEVEPASTENQEDTIGQEDSELGPDNLIEDQKEMQDTKEQIEITTNEDVEMKNLTNSNEEKQKPSVKNESKGKIIFVTSDPVVKEDSDPNKNSDKTINDSESGVKLEEKSIQIDENPDSSMKIHLEIHSADKETAPSDNDIDITIGTMKNDDCV